MSLVHEWSLKVAVSEVAALVETVVATCQRSHSATVVTDNVRVSSRAIRWIVNRRRIIHQFAKHLLISLHTGILPRILGALSFRERRVVNESSIVVNNERISSTSIWLIVWMLWIEGSVEIVINRMVHL